MKTIFIGDIHGRSVWKLIVNRENPDRVVFIGDYFDSYDEFTTEEQVNNFLDIMEFKKTSGVETICLIGNHDHHYFPAVGNTGTSGYQTIGKVVIEYVIEENKEHLQIAYQFDDVLCTHAGVTNTFLNNAFGEGEWSIDTVADSLNDLFRFKPQSFCFGVFRNRFSADPYGDDVFQSPIWVRPRSLQSDAIDKKQIVQIVGHTQQNQIDIKGKSTGGRFYYIDTLGTSGEYLILNEGQFSVGSVK